MTFLKYLLINKDSIGEKSRDKKVEIINEFSNYRKISNYWTMCGL